MLEEYSNYIFYIIAGLIFLFLIYYCYSLKTIKEGLTNPMEGPSVTNDDWANLNSNLKDQVQLLKSKVGIKENRKEYEDMIIDLDTTIDYMILQNLTMYSNAIVNNNESDKKKYMNNINNLKSIKSQLDSTMQFIDKN